MANKLPLSTVVRIGALPRLPSEYDPYKLNIRPPSQGDTGAIVDILARAGMPVLYVVESYDHTGNIIWLSEFRQDEIEPALAA